jgi:hypothetical protein
MTANTSEQTSLDLLISLKSQYEYALTEANSKSVYLREQLAHVNALLLNQLLPSNQLQPLQTKVDTAPTLALSAQIEALGDQSVFPSLTVAEPVLAINNARASKSRAQKQTSTKATPKSAKANSKRNVVGGPDRPTATARPPKREKIAASKRNSLTPLPTYQGLRKLDAIAQVLEAERNQEVTIDSVVQSLYGNLSAAEHKAERLRMKTALFQGVQKGFWQKSATTPSSYFTGSLKGQGRKTAKGGTAAKSSKEIPTSGTTQTSQAIDSKTVKSVAQRGAKASKAAAKPKAATTTTAKKRNSLPLLPAYAAMKKLDAIGIVLEKNRNEVLHHDTIIQMLYGDLSLADLKAERVRIKTALLTGVKDKRWEKSPLPSSYVLRSGTAASKPKSSIKTVKARSSAKARLSKK